MLGDKIGEEQGRVTTRRVLPGDDPRYVKMEITFEAETTLLGVRGNNIGTYVMFERLPGQIYGEGQGMMMTEGGDGVIWNGHGIGQVREGGVIAFAASIAFQTNSEALARLNGVLGLVEHQVDMEGGARSTIYEWKA